MNFLKDKSGKVKLLILFLVSLIVFSSVFTYAFIEDKNYVLGDEVKINLKDYINYTLKIITPESTLIKEGSEDIFLFPLNYVGTYNFNVKSLLKEDKKTIEVFSEINEETNLVKNNFSSEEKLEEKVLQKVEENNNVENISDDEETFVENESVLLEEIKIGEPVKWQKNVTLNENETVLTLPSYSENIKVFQEGAEVNYSLETSVLDSLKKVLSIETEKKILIDSGEVTEINYETPAPVKKEKELSETKKEVVVSSDFHYENVFTTTNVTERYKLSEKDLIKIYWKEEGRYLDFQVYDNNNNGLIDEIGWTVPHLSTQTFEVILISKAEHLDENRTFIEEVYDLVKEQDYVFSNISNKEYLRVSFEKNLTNENDITVYARGNGTIFVYQKDSQELIAKFGVIGDYDRYKVLLSSLVGEEDVFDLEVIGNVEFDYVVDPSFRYEVCYFNSYSSTNWDTTPANMVDGNTGTYASDNDNGGLQTLNANNCTSSNLGEISQVEVRYFGRKNNNGVTIRAGLRPVFSGGTGSSYDPGNILYSTADYISWHDITTDTNAPSTWTWSDISNLDMGVLVFRPNTGTVYVSQVEVRITYIGNDAPTHSTPLINSSLGTNMTSENLTCISQNSNDFDGDSVKNIFNWDKNGTSFATINLPFEGNESTKDFSGNSYDVSSIGAVFNRSSGHDSFGAYTFDGSSYLNSFVDLSSVLGGTASLSFWIKTSQTGSDTMWQAPGVTGIEESGGGNDIFWGWIDASGHIGITVGNGANAKSTSAINDNTYHHVVLTRDSSSGRVEVYVDGTLNSNAISDTGSITNSFSSFGRIEDTGGTPAYFVGSLDELLVFDFVLSPEQINSLEAGGFQNITSSETEVGDSFSCEITPTDSYLNGQTLSSSGLLVLEEVIPNSLGLSLIYPTSSSVYVEKDAFFNVTLNVTCLSGNCGTVNVTLDPIIETYNDFETGTEGFEHFPLNEKNDQWHISTESTNNGTYAWKCGDIEAAAYLSLSDSILVTPTYEIEGNSTFSFYHYLFTEPGYDGGVLEYSLDGGLWQKFNNFISGGYNDQYQEYSGGPDLINGEDIWSSTVGGATSFQQVVLNMSQITGENITFRFHFFSDSSVTREGWYIDSVNFTTTTPSMEKGIIPVGSGTPFYTNATSNPLTTNSLSSGQSQIVTFYVNATGDIDREYFFFAYANLTSDASISNITNIWNVTISVNQELPNITINYPTAGSINDATPVLDIDLTGDAKDLWYNINGGANQTLCNNCNFSDEEVLYLREADYVVNVYASNPMGEVRHKSVSFNVDMNNNYYDSFNDDSAISSSEKIEALNGNITLQLKNETILFEEFENSQDWSLIGGQWQINTNNELAQRQDATDSLAVYNVFTIDNETDYNITYRLYSTDNDYSGFLFGYQNSSNYYRCQVRQQSPIDAEIVQVIDGSESTLSSYSDGTSYSTYSWNDMLLEIKNHTVSCYVNGVLATSASNVYFPVGYVGIYNDINDEARHDNFSISITGGKKSGIFTSYAIDLIDTITKFTNITWNEYKDNSNNSLRVEVSADNGNNWYEATKNNGLFSIITGDKFVYRVFFELEDISLISLLDLNVSWSNSVEPPPEILIEGINTPIEQDYTPILNVTLVGDALSLLMSINGGSNQTICTSCSGSNIVPVVLSEGAQTIRFYANNSVGTFSSNSTSFTVNFDKHYFDNFTDDSSIKEINGVTWNEGNVTFYETYSNTTEETNWDATVQTADTSWSNSGRTTYSYRNVLEGSTINASGDYVRINFISGTDGTLGVNNPSICERSGTTSDCVSGTWHQLTFGGASSYVIPSSSNYYTDWLEYNIDSSKDYLVTFYVDGTNTAVSYLSPSRAMVYSISGADYSLTQDWSSLSPTFENLMYGVSLMQVKSVVAGGKGNFTSYTMNTSQPVTSFSYVGWTETGVDANNNISLELSVDNGNSWVSATNGGSVSGFTPGSNLIYRVLYSAIDLVNISFTDLNITWQSPPTVEILYPQTYVYNYQITEMNYSVSYAQGTTLDTCWYSLNGGVTNTTVNCNQNITGISSNDGENIWTIYANDTSGMMGYTSVTFSVDTAAPVITFLNQTNEEGEIVDGSNLLYSGDNLTLNVNVTDANTETVWVVIWENVIGGVEKTIIFFDNLFGDWWSTNVETDETFGENYNYTIYANDSTGLVDSYNGTFDILKLILNLDLNPSVSVGNEDIFMSGYLNFSNGTAIKNYAINFWMDNLFIPFTNLTNQGSSQNSFNFTEDEIKILSTYDNVTYSSGEFTLDGANTSGSFTGVLDAGARVDWGNIFWQTVSQPCSGSVDYQEGDTNSYSGTEDTYITSLNPNTNYGGVDYLTVDSSPDTERSLVKFNDILGFGENKIPYGSTISSATFRLSVYDTGDNPNFYEVLENWTENEATYTYRNGEDLWSSLGVATSPSINTTSLGSMSTATTGIKALDVTNTVQRWSSRAIDNNGFVIHPIGSGNVLFRSSEYATQNERPRLSVSFSSSDCAGILVYVRTSNDKTTWSSWREVLNGENITDSFGVSRYLEYKVEMGAFNSTYDPQLQFFNVSYSGLFTDENGFFNYSLISTDVFGSYKINVTSGLKKMLANAQSVLSVQSGVPPSVSLISPTNNTWSNSSTYTFYYNATDLNGDFSLVEFILDGVVNMTNSTIVTSGINNFTINGLSAGVHTWSVNLSDVASTNFSETRTINVDLGNPVVNLIYPLDTSSHNVGFLNLTFNASDDYDDELICNVTLDSEVIGTVNVTNGSSANVTTPGLSGGQHFWEVTCYDNSFRSFLTDAWSFTITDTPPSVNLSSPEDNYVDSDGDLEFIYFVEDNSGINHCDLLINGEVNSTNSSVEILENNSFFVFGFNEGYYNWSVDCYDLSLTKVSTENRTFGVDSNSPTINLLSPENNSNSSTSLVNFQFNVTDTIDSVLNCSIYIEGVEDLIFSTNSGEISNQTSLTLSDGPKEWYLNCSDDSNNFGISETRVVNVLEYPNVSINNTNSTYAQGNSFIVDFIPHDNTGIDSCTVYLNGVANTTVSSGIVLDSINNLEVEGLNDGRYTYYVNCSDTYGLSNSSLENVFFIDNLSPTIEVYSPNGEDLYSSNITFEFKVFDLVSEEVICNLSVDSNVVDENISVMNNTNISRVVSGILDGYREWNLFCVDLAENSNTSLTYNFTKYTAPGVSLVEPLDFEWVNESNFDFVYFPQDDEGFLKTELIINGLVYMENESLVTSGINNSFSVVGFSDGIYNWSINVTDLTSMIGASENRTLYVDTHAPLVNVISPVQDEIIDDNNVSFEFNISENLDDSIFCNLSIDGDVEYYGEFVNGTNIANVLLVDGNHTYSFSCVDNATNLNITNEINFTVYSPPQINLTSPVNDFRTNLSTINFSYIPVDSLGLNNCSLYIDDSIEETDEGVVKNVVNNFTISGIIEGKHNWSVGCFDTDLNFNMSQYRNFTYDITPPSIILVSPKDDEKVDSNAGSVYFTWGVVDALDVAIQCDLYVDAVRRKQNIWITNNTNNTESVSGLTIGEHSWNVTCWDRAYNYNNSETRNFTYSTPDFKISDVTVNSSTPVENEGVLFNATIENVGGADSKNVLVEFYSGYPLTGVQVYNETINISVGETVYVDSVLIMEIGLNEIYAVVDWDNSFSESNESNNLFSKNLSVGAWQFFYGDITGTVDYSLAIDEGDILVWDASGFQNGSVFVSDKGSVISWGDLLPLGKTKTLTDSVDDFSDADTLLSMNGFSDSVSNLYLNGGTPYRTEDIMIFGNTINNILMTNSTSNLNFQTGILWDSSDSGDNEYDTTEKEDLVFVSKIKKDTVGNYGTYDYEMRVPAMLREYSGITSEAVFYVEVF
ncbi:DNRLRE domain-containing protein [archaeon]|nr:DNRLRE domain-containing protein [archaeon]